MIYFTKDKDTNKIKLVKCECGNKNGTMFYTSKDNHDKVYCFYCHKLLYSLHNDKILVNKYKMLSLKQASMFKNLEKIV